MKLTSVYTRVAMPHESRCPHCNNKIEDWHREWYVSPDQERLLFQGKAAADCPLCGGPVYPWQQEKPPNPLESIYEVPVLKRSRANAEKYCRGQLGISLTDYIKSTISGQQYADYEFDA